jgi:hypothetical protein
MNKILSLFGLLMLALVHAGAQVSPAPSLMTFQGRLTASSGNPVADGSYSLRFSLWDSLTGGTEKWNQTITTVAVRNGTFAVLLSGVPPEIFHSDLWLEMKIGTDPALSPRQQLASVAYAMKANSVPDASIGTLQLASASVTTAKIASAAVNRDKIADGAVVSPKIGQGAVTNEKLANGAVDSSKIADNAVTERKIANASVTSAKIVSEAVTSNLLAFDRNSLLRVTDSLMDVAELPESVDQNAEAGSNSLAAAAYWQSFTPGVTGNLAAMAFTARSLTNASQTVRVTLRSGEGTAGTILATQVFNLPPANTPLGAVQVNFTAEIPLTAGMLYTWEISDNAANSRFYTTVSNYAGGRSHFDASKDLAFTTYMQTGTPTDILVINRLGVGLTMPSERLDVNGTVRMTGFKMSTGATSGWVLTSDLAGRGTWQPLNFTGAAGGDLVGAYPNPSLANHPSLLAKVSGGGMTALMDGSIGIGTAAPGARLHISSGATNGTGLFLENSDTGGHRWQMVSSGSVNSTGAGDLIFSDQTSGGIRMVLDEAGNVGIGQSNPGAGFKLDVNGIIRATGPLNTSSDARYKTDVRLFENALDTILNLRGVTYQWRKSEFPAMNFADGKQIGFLAQELEKILPELVTTDEDGYKSVAYQGLIPVLVEAVKTQQAQLEAQRKQIMELEAQASRIQSLEARLAELAAQMSRLQTGTR